MTLPFAMSAMHVGSGVALLSQNCVAVLQLTSVTQAFEQAPLAMQVTPACAAPGSAHVMAPPVVPHVVQAPPRPGQYGVALPQVAVAEVVLSPLQAVQVSVDELQTVAPLHADWLVRVQTSQKPCPPLRVGSQTLLRQTVVWLVVVQLPAPLGVPQTLSAPHVFERQPFDVPAWVAVAPVHDAFAGITMPFATFATHVLLAVLQNCDVVQSPSTLQPVAVGLQVLFTEQEPLRQAPASFAHGPCPFA